MLNGGRDKSGNLKHEALSDPKCDRLEGKGGEVHGSGGMSVWGSSMGSSIEFATWKVCTTSVALHLESTYLRTNPMHDGKRFSISSRRRQRAKSPGSGLSSTDLPRTSTSSLQAPQTSTTASETAQEGIDGLTIPLGSSHDSRPSPSFRNRLLKGIRRLSLNPERSNKSNASSPEQPMSTTPLQSSPHNPLLSPPSLDSGESIDHPRLTLNEHTIYDAGARGQPKPADVNSLNSAPLSVPAPSVSSGSDNDHKKTIIGATKLLLQAAAVALKFAPIANLDQIPNILLTWIQICEVSASLSAASVIR